ncbi:MAG: histidinol-phosphatase HisJ family protein [Phycisphaeraceae bacterium]|nr:histidinol-phosphatase HisJ family protein [Phycisphaeraceae bacterium]
MPGTWHNHTRWSDGKGTVTETIAAAHARGVRSLGISDHLIVDPAGTRHAWAMDPARLHAYIAEVRSAHAPPGMSVLCGVEADYIPSTAARTASLIASHALDHVVASVHVVDGFTIDLHPEPWARLDPAARHRVHERYWMLVAEMAEARFGSIAGHLDLPKKFGFRPDPLPWSLIERALDAIAGAGMVVELNTAGWHKPCAEQYPSLDILRACRAREIPVTISADAHEPSHLLRDFDRAADVLRDAGYDAVEHFTRSGRESRPLA